MDDREDEADADKYESEPGTPPPKSRKMFTYPEPDFIDNDVDNTSAPQDYLARSDFHTSYEESQRVDKEPERQISPDEIAAEYVRQEKLDRVDPFKYDAEDRLPSALLALEEGAPWFRVRVKVRISMPQGDKDD